MNYGYTILNSKFVLCTRLASCSMPQPAGMEEIIMNEVLRPRNFGELLAQTLSVTMGNLGKLLTIQVLFWFPVFVIAAIVLVLIVPAIVLTGVLVTFRVVGPLQRIETYLRDLASGAPVGECRIRARDEAQGLCDAVNAAVKTLRGPNQPEAKTPAPAPDAGALVGVDAGSP